MEVGFCHIVFLTHAEKHASKLMEDDMLRLKLWRLQHGLTQEQAARLLGMGESTFALLESGRLRPTPHQLETLGRHFGRETESLFEPRSGPGGERIVMPADRDRIVEMLLEDPPPSCRAVSRATGYSDWTIRKIARELGGDSRPMRQRRSHSYEAPPEELSPIVGWLVFGSIVAVIALAIWSGARWALPPEQ
jgi:transcriptional regulator with XRE-family HTH domain